MVNSALTDTAQSPPAPPRSLPLERKLPLLILGVLAFVLALSLAISYYAVRRSAIVSAGERLTSLSHALSSMFHQQIVTRLGMMARVADDTAIVNALRRPDRAPSGAVLRALAPLAGRADSLTPPQLWTGDGQAVGAVRLELPAEAQHIREEVRRLAMSNDTTPFVSKVFTNGRQISYWEAFPVQDEAEVLGYVVQERRFGVNPRAVQPFRDLIGSDIDFYLRETSEKRWAQVIGDSSSNPAGTRTYDGSLELVDLGTNGQALSSTTRIPGASFSVALVRPMSAILERPIATIRVLTVLSILLTVLGGLVAWSISRQLTRPLVELTHAAEAIADGEYSKRVATNGRDEIGRLGSAFNQMAHKVEVASNHSTEAVDQLTQTVATQQFLADASRLLSMSLSDQMLLVELARFCVPTIADHCSLYVMDDDGTLRRVESAHYNPAKQDALRRLVARYEYRIDGPGEVGSSRVDLQACKLEYSIVSPK